MSYEIEDWYDLGDFARSRYLQPDEEPEMSQPGNKNFDKRLQDLPKPFNPYRGVPISREDIVEKSALMGDDWVVRNCFLVEEDQYRVPNDQARALRADWRQMELQRKRSSEEMARDLKSARIIGYLLGGGLVVAVIGFIAWWVR